MRFEAPWMFWALALIAIPIAIHLFLRARPRPAVFPALRLLRSVLTQGERARRMRDALLLALRVAAVTAVVGVLARPTCQQQAGAHVGRAAFALIIDDAAPMRYRTEFGGDRTLVDLAQDAARRYVHEVAQRGSLFAVLRTSESSVGRGLTSDMAAALSQSAAPHGARHARPLGAALAAAVEALRPAGDLERRIVVFTDGGGAAWRDVGAGLLASAGEIGVEVVAVGPAQPQDLRVAVDPVRRVVPERSATAIQAHIRSSGIAAVGNLAARLPDDTLLARSAPLSISADGVATATVRLPPRPAGVYGARIDLEPRDLLDEDQTQYVTWQTGPTPVVWIATSSTAADDPAILILANLLAPASLPDDEQRVRVELLDETAFGAALSGGDHDAARPTLMLVLPGVGIDAAQAAATATLVERGTTIVLIPAGSTLDLDWPVLRAWLTDAAPHVEPLTDATTMHAVRAGPADAAFRELARVDVRRRVRISGWSDGVEVAARFGDGVDAIASRRRGRGQIVWLATSPDPRWSDLGIRAAGLLLWLHGVLDDAIGSPAAAADFVAGEPADHVFASLPADGLVKVTCETDAAAAPVWRRLTEGRPESPWPTGVAGLYAITHDGDVRARYAVNWPADAFDAPPIDAETLARRLGTRDVALVRGVDELLAGGAAAGLLGRGPSLAALAALLALTLLIGEALLAGARRSHSADATR